MKAVNIGNPACKRVLTQLDSYLSNELTVKTAGEVVAHLERCPQCQEVFRIWELVRRRLRAALANEEVSPEATKRVSRVLRKASVSWISRVCEWPRESSNN